MSGFRYLGAEAFVFGFPLLTMAARMRRATDVARRSDGAPGKRIEGQAPPNQFAHLDRFPDPTLTAVVAANANTLYSLAWLDLADEPILLELPPTGGRSYLLPLVDAWTNVIACLGPRTNGQAGGVYALAGPGWEGDLPSGVRRIDSATNTIWAISHIHSFDGEEDLAADLSIQRHLRLSPLSAFGGTTAPPERIAGAAPEFDRARRQPVAEMRTEEFLARLAAEMGRNPPSRRDFPLLERLATIGVSPGERFDWTGLSEEARESLEAGMADGRALVAAVPPRSSRNGWETHGDDLGSFGTDYRRRAQVANVALGTVPPEDASFPTTARDSDGHRTRGSHRYRVRFELDNLPPVHALWSLSLYDMDQLVVANEIDRYALGDRNALDHGRDGSVELAVQHDRPRGSDANWLPAPEGDFNLMLHMYWPDRSALDGSWAIPAVQRVE